MNFINNEFQFSLEINKETPKWFEISLTRKQENNYFVNLISVLFSVDNSFFTYIKTLM